MRSQSLVHDHAMQLAGAVLGIVAPCLREEERREAFELVYAGAVQALKRYEVKADRLTRRVRPSAN